MAMTPMPTPAPSRTMSQVDFDAAAALHIAALPAFITEANALQTDVNAKQATASAAAVTATDQVALAADQVALATAQAELADADAIATAADRVQTGLDRTQTGIDRTAAEAAAATAGGAAAFTDANPVVKGSADDTKRVRFEVDALTTATTRVLTVPDEDLTLAGRGANTFTGAQILSDQQVSRAMLIDCGYVYLDKGNSGTSLQTFDYTAGSVQKVTATGNHTFAFSNWPPTGNEGYMRVDFVDYGAYTITPPVVVWTNPDGTETTTLSAHFTALAAAGGRAGFTASGLTKAIFWCKDAVTVYGRFI